jgi:hypothetical protein
MIFQEDAFPITVDSSGVENVNGPEVLTKRDKALKVLRTGTIITCIGAGFIGIGVYGIERTPSEIFPLAAIGAGIIGITVTTVGLNISIAGIIKLGKDHRRSNSK